MKFALAKEHREFYAHNHFIEFEKLLTEEEVALLSETIKEILSKRIKPKSLASRTAHELYLAGRDLWRESPVLQKIVLKRELAYIAAELFKQPYLQIAFDQYQDELFPLSLAQMSCIRPIVAAIALPLDANPAGRAFFFRPTSPLTFPFCNTPLLIIAYTESHAQYTLTKEDAHTHALKKLGYSFGDHITVKTHPAIVK